MSKFWSGILILICFAVLGRAMYVFSMLHIEGAEKCAAANGVWLDRELKCINAKEIK